MKLARLFKRHLYVKKDTVYFFFFFQPKSGTLSQHKIVLQYFKNI